MCTILRYNWILLLSLNFLYAYFGGTWCNVDSIICIWKPKNGKHRIGYGLNYTICMWINVHTGCACVYENWKKIWTDIWLSLSHLMLEFQFGSYFFHIYLINYDARKKSSHANWWFYFHFKRIENRRREKENERAFAHQHFDWYEMRIIAVKSVNQQ